MDLLKVIKDLIVSRREIGLSLLKKSYIGLNCIQNTKLEFKKSWMRILKSNSIIYKISEELNYLRELFLIKIQK